MGTPITFLTAKHADLVQQDRIPNGAFIVCEDVSRMYVKLHLPLYTINTHYRHISPFSSMSYTLPQ